MAFKFRSSSVKIFLLAWYNGKGVKKVDVSGIFKGKVYDNTCEGEDSAGLKPCLTY